MERLRIGIAEALVAAAEWIVPGWYRPRWRAEWRAELAHHGGGDADRMARAAGAWRHALWLRMQEWRAEIMWQDLRYAVRSFARSKGFAAIAVLTLAIGIGANTVVFGMVNTILLRPYPYPDAERLVVVEETDDRGRAGLPLSLPDAHDLRTRAATLEGVSVWDWEPFNLRLADRTHWVPSGQVSWNHFEILRARPIVGRTFREGEDRPDADPVAVLGEGLWRDLFAADPAVVGRTVVLDGRPTEIVGVVPDWAAVPDDARLWIPLQLDPDWNRGAHWLGTIARLADGATLEEANAEARVIAASLEAEYPDTNEGRGFRIVSLREDRTQDSAAMMFVLLGSVGFLLLIVCANVASLLLARASARERELGVRAALGASRTRLVRQLVTETVVLAAVGAVLGFLLAQLGTDAIVASVPEALPAWMSVEPDARVVGFLIGVSLLAALLAGVAPAWRASRPDLRVAITGGGRGGGDRRSRHRARRALVAAEVAISVTLLVGAGLMVRSFVKLTAVDPGFAAENRLTARMALSRGVYDTDAERVEFMRATVEEIRALPGVRSTSFVDRPPLGGSSNTMSVFIEGQTQEESERNPGVLVSRVGPEYFATMGIPLLRGRELTAADDSSAAPAAVVSEEMAGRFWPGEDPLGRRFTFSSDPEAEDWLQVVGVVGGVRHFGLEDEPVPHAYTALAQNPTNRLSVVVRAVAAPAALTDGVRRAIRAVDPDVAPADEMTLEELVSRATWEAGFFTRLFWIFGLIAVVLAAVGVYGVVSVAVTQRTREFGIRMALGSGRAGLLKLVLSDAGRVVGIGLGLGLAAAWGLSRVMRGLLYEIEPGDPLTFFGVAVVLAAMGMLAAWVPASRAAKVDPAVALREE